MFIHICIRESDMNIVVIVQARMNSTRLPGKVMLPVLGKSLLIRQIERIKASHLSTSVVVATTTENTDDLIVKLCHNEGIECFRGDENDVLDRHYQAGLYYNADVIIKIPSDCPLIDPRIIDKVIKFYIDHCTEYDFVSNLHPATYPDGNDVEVIPMSILEYTHKHAKNSYEREHTTPFIWDNPDMFRIGNCTWELGYDFSMSHRWTLDYPEDYHFIAEVYKKLYIHNPLFGLYDILSLVEDHPEITEINSRFVGVNWYRKHLHQLKTVNISQTRLEYFDDRARI